MTTRARASDAFFASLAADGGSTWLEHASGALRFDLRAGDAIEHLRVEIDHGLVNVSDSDEPVVAVVRTDVATFEGMVAGEINATAALLRGDVVAEGDLGLLLLFQRLFPGPPRDGHG